MNKAVAKVVASVAFMGVAGFGVTACGNNPPATSYEQVWENGHYVYVPTSYYQSHRSYYSNTLHPARKVSSSYVKTHHVTVVHKTVVHKTTTVKRHSSKTTTHHTSTVHKYRSSSRSKRR